MDRSGHWLRGLTGLLLAVNLGVALIGFAVRAWPGRVPVLPNMNGDQIQLGVVLSATSKTRKAAGADSGSLATEAGQAAEMDAGRCLVWNKLDPERLAALDKVILQQGLKGDDYVWEVDEPLGWWVYLLPFPDAVKMRAAIEDARHRGVSDAGPVHGGALANAVSLGVFPDMDRARQHAELMSRKGIHDVRYGLRPKVESVRLVLSKPASASLAEAMRLASRGVLPEACVTKSAR